MRAAVHSQYSRCLCLKTQADQPSVFQFGHRCGEETDSASPFTCTRYRARFGPSRLRGFDTSGFSGLTLFRFQSHSTLASSECIDLCHLLMRTRGDTTTHGGLAPVWRQKIGGQGSTACQHPFPPQSLGIQTSPPSPGHPTREPDSQYFQRGLPLF